MKLLRYILAVLPTVLLVALPLLLRPSQSHRIESRDDADTLVILSPHTEAIRSEFSTAFAKYYKNRTGRNIVTDWRSVGGTSDIVKYIDDRFQAAFRSEWESAGHSWDAETLKAFKNTYENSHPVRKRFLSSDVSIGVDIFFGGGTYDHNKFAQLGYGVDAGVAKRHPEYFKEDIIPQSFSGETFYDKEGRFYGVCLSSFGIAYNADRYRDLKLPPPEQWRDLGHPALFRQAALADPTKSGSITKCYEMIIQQAMSENPDDLSKGWEQGLMRIKLAGANSRYYTDSAGKLVRDVSSGAAAAGMCIDFYGLSEAEYTNGISGRPRISYVMPRGGSAVTADPVQLLRGAPNRLQAEMFIDFTLSPEGQKLWIYKPGTPSGPEKHSLQRSCIRRDLYAEEYAQYRSNPSYNPYTAGGAFEYRGAWTGRYFSLIRVLVKCIVLDPMESLSDAWKAVQENGGAADNPEAMRLIRELPFSYSEAAAQAKRLSGSPEEAEKARREWTMAAMENYKKAAKSARAAKDGPDK